MSISLHPPLETAKRTWRYPALLVNQKEHFLLRTGEGEIDALYEFWSFAFFHGDFGETAVFNYQGGGKSADFFFGPALFTLENTPCFRATGNGIPVSHRDAIFTPATLPRRYSRATVVSPES